MITLLTTFLFQGRNSSFKLKGDEMWIRNGDGKLVKKESFDIGPWDGSLDGTRHQAIKLTRADGTSLFRGRQKMPTAWLGELDSLTYFVGERTYRKTFAYSKPCILTGSNSLLDDKDHDLIARAFLVSPTTTWKMEYKGGDVLCCDSGVHVDEEITGVKFRSMCIQAGMTVSQCDEMPAAIGEVEEIKVGDRVVITGCPIGLSDKRLIGCEGTVLYCERAQWKIEGYEKKGAYYHWWYNRNDFELVREDKKEEKPKFKVGDWVKVERNPHEYKFGAYEKSGVFRVGRVNEGCDTGRDGSRHGHLISVLDNRVYDDCDCSKYNFVYGTEVRGVLVSGDRMTFRLDGISNSEVAGKIKAYDDDVHFSLSLDMFAYFEVS